MKSILIGIQARSGSTRLPGKAFALISGRMMLERVLEACKAAASGLSKITSMPCQVAILTPEGDEIAKQFRLRATIVEGPEFDVLGRYAVAAEKLDPSYIVRITGDCPMITVATIKGLVNLAVKHQYDYISNVDERFRTSMDGVDCEVISRRLLDYAIDAAKEPYDREHVTPYIRRHPPVWAKTAVCVNYFDLSHVKLSVDTEEDLSRVRQAFDSAFEKYQEAVKVFGSAQVHRI